ncbi:MAG: hybrid sensor histidine kinase/response regulator, partial [Leptolyngbya sp. SIO1D8]|nr:hybrid sensor histidine kinase/response regulator [Leptolyngbya sp. SIO1D8]
IQLLADRDRIQQLLTNLLSNAIKFSSSGGIVRLTAQVIDKPDNPKTTGTAISLPSMPFLHITVRDQGRGIPEDKLHLIFERFQQVDASDARAKGGTGLGLSICQQIVHQHQGQIWAESMIGKGSTFNVLLPLGDLTSLN